jgi:hypothetical protein
MRTETLGDEQTTYFGGSIEQGHYILCPKQAPILQNDPFPHVAANFFCGFLKNGISLAAI